MERNEIKEPLPEEFTSLEKAAEFWETHSLDQSAYAIKSSSHSSIRIV
jgi:hypothetical protein